MLRYCTTGNILPSDEEEQHEVLTVHSTHPVKTKVTCDILRNDNKAYVAADSASDTSLMNEKLFTQHFLYDAFHLCQGFVYVLSC